MGSKKNIVPFERSAVYLYQRAMRNRRSGELLDALELLRIAISKDPENAEYPMDLAELLCEMGNHMESNEVLVRLYARPSAPNECLFGICSNYYGMNEPESAYRALTFFLSNEPKASTRPEVSDMLENLMLFRELFSVNNRKEKRAARWFEQGMESVRTSDLTSALDRFERALKVDPEMEDARAAYALCLLEQKRDEEALLEFQKLNRTALSLKSAMIGARIHHRTGDVQAAVDLLTEAADNAEDFGSYAPLLMTACDLNMHEWVREWVPKALKDAPYDRRILHIAAAAHYNTGAKLEFVTPYWVRIRRLDPEDTVAPNYLELAELQKLHQPIRYNYQVPESERLERVKYLSDIVAQGIPHIQALWRESPQFKRMLIWALKSDEQYFQKVAVNILSVIDEPDVEAVFRSYLMNPNATDALKRQVLILMSAGAARQPFLVHMGKGFAMAHVNPTNDTQRIPVKYRRVLKTAIRRALPVYGDLTAPLSEMWLQYVQKRSGHLKPIRNPEGWAAGLVYSYFLKQPHKSKEIFKLSQLFRCSARMMTRRAKEIARKGTKEEVAHEAD